jgi:site-specific DNA-cytosine methylase
MTINIVDVNGLNGALALGVVKAGAKLSARTGYLTLGQPIINANSHLWGDDWVDDLMPEEAHNWEAWPVRSSADIVTAVPPCSGFSVLTGKAGAGKGAGAAAQRNADHPMNDCMWSSARYAARHSPDVFMFESVTGAFKIGRGLMQNLRDELEKISGERYTLTHWLHDGCVMGAPTSRQRYMFVAVKGDAPFAVTPVDDYAVENFTPMWEAVRDLEGLKIQMPDQPLVNAKRAGDWGRARHRADGAVDGLWFYTGLWTRRILGTVTALRDHGNIWPEGGGQSNAMRKLYQIGGEVQLSQVLENPDLAKRFIDNDFNFGPYAASREVRKAMNTLIAGGGTGNHIHPTEDRFLTYRELARVQGWPDDLRIDFDTSVYGKEKLESVWGKAVGCLVGEHAGSEAVDWVNGNTAGKMSGELIGDREWLIDDLDHSRRLRRENSRTKKEVKVMT